MATAYLGLGANLGDPGAQLDDAIARLDAHPDIDVVKRSQRIVTKAWGRTRQPDFTNQVIAIETTLKAHALLDACLQIEDEMGRIRKEVWGPRVIDIDVIVYEDVVIKSARLTLPHPYAHQRDFVLDPLREIAPEAADWVLERAKAPQ